MNPAERPASEATPIHSMTGYASLRIDAAEHTSFTLTLKSVNHRFLDLQLRLPQSFEALEPMLRRMLKEKIHRGHVEFGLQLDRQAQAGVFLKDEQIAAYLEVFRRAAKVHGLSCEPDLNEILRLPGMMNSQQSVVREGFVEIEVAVLAAFHKLVADFNEVRASEGADLCIELRGSMQRIESAMKEVSALRQGMRETAFERLRSRIAKVAVGLTVSDERLLTEAALLVERSDIEEELVRIYTHTTTFERLLDEGGALGKRLDFLLQELNREANTLLSKTSGASSQNELRITELGLDMKVEIERAREQIQNIE